MTAELLKEFFYVDVDRTRSLLAQLQGGVIETLTSETANTLEGSAGASLFGIGGSGGYSRGSSSQESRSPTSVMFRGRIERLEQMVDGILSFSPTPPAKNSNPQHRKKIAVAAKAAILGGITSDQLQAMTGFVDAFVGQDIAFRARECGSDHLTSGFGGTLLGRREYIQEERESLFGRYGTVASSWTCVMQIAAIPNAPEPDLLPAGGGDVEAPASPARVGVMRPAGHGRVSR